MADSNDGGPNQTLYLNNLPDKLSKDKTKRQLYNICSKFGSILDIIVRPGQSMRGQAWVVFSSVEIATKALTKLNGYVFFQKPLKVQFAKQNADVVAKLEGRYVARQKRPSNKGEDQPNVKRAKPTATEEDGNGSMTTAAAAPASIGGGGHDSNNPPGPILKVDNIPEEVPKDTLVELFSKYDGYLDLRHVPAKMVAFAEYRTTDQAKLAREGLRGYQITSTHKLRVNFAKPRE